MVMDGRSISRGRRSATVTALVVMAALGGAGRARAEAELPPTASGDSQDPFTTNPFGEGAGAPAEGANVPPAEREARAAELAVQGRTAFDAHRLEEAAQLLEQAYRLGRDARVLYPLALALHDLGHHEAAEERLRRYLAEAELDGSQRYVVQLQLQGWRRQFSRVDVETVPSGAELLLGSQRVGVTPLAQPLVLPNGEYQLEARLDGYHTLRRQLLVPGGDPVALRLELERLEAAGTPRRGLDVALWASVGLTGALAIAAIAVTIVAAERAEALDAALYPTPEQVDEVAGLAAGRDGLWGATGGMVGVTLALGVVRVVLGRRAAAPAGAEHR
jgi:tetratricopeptide (TPR) repeat protein